MKYTLDTEFLDDGITVDLISIGLFCEDGREYYAVNQDAPWGIIQANEWLMSNVVRPHICVFGEINYQNMKTRGVIADDVLAFLRVGLTEPDRSRPRSEWECAETWAWYSAHDHVVLTQLWGPMVNAPWGVPMRTNCLKQEAMMQRRRGVAVELPEQEKHTEHHALFDAHFDMYIAHALGVIGAPTETRG